MYIEERFSSFPPDLPWKSYSGFETGHVKFSNIFSHEKPKTFRLKKNEIKKNKFLKGKKFVGRIVSILPKNFSPFKTLFFFISFFFQPAFAFHVKRCC